MAEVETAAILGLLAYPANAHIARLGVQDALETWNTVDREDLLRGCEYALSFLKPRYLRALELRLRDKVTFNTIADEFGVTSSRARDIYRRALRDAFPLSTNNPRLYYWRYGWSEGARRDQEAIAKFKMLNHPLPERLVDIDKVLMAEQQTNKTMIVRWVEPPQKRSTEGIVTLSKLNFD